MIDNNIGKSLKKITKSIERDSEEITANIWKDIEAVGRKLSTSETDRNRIIDVICFIYKFYS